MKLTRKEIDKIIDEIYKLSSCNSTAEEVFSLENKVLELDNAELSFFFAKLIPIANIKKHQEVVLKSKEPSWCYRFATYVKGADIFALTNVVLESKDPLYNLLCARDIPQIIPEFDIVPFEDVILELEDPKWSIQFLIVKGARVELHNNIINAKGKQKRKSIFR